MNITPIQKGIGEAASTAFEAVKNAFSWLGHQISVGFDKFAEVMKAAWNSAYPFIKDLAIRTVDFLRTAPGIGLVLGVTSLALGYTAQSMSDKKWIALSLQVSAIAAAVGAGLVVGYGYATGLTNPLI